MSDNRPRPSWENVTVPLSALTPWPINPRTIEDVEAERLTQSFAEFGQVETVAIGPNGDIYNGHQRLKILLEKHGDDYEIEARQSSRPLTEDERKKLTVYLHKGATGEWVPDSLVEHFDPDDLGGWGFDDFELAEFGFDIDFHKPKAHDAEPQTSRADELQELWQVETGQLWRLPSRTEGQEHRLICGDCTDGDVVARLFGNDVADMIHADPPYGMGKEKDGILNDNLYREKLDAFQMQWWMASRPHVADNGSAYIWGNAPDLWRLWYLGGLRDSERLTFRNMITWDKANESGLYDGNGIGSGLARMYAAIAEHCIFFMLGEQGFNNNADNYWETWDSIREYLKVERDKMGWSIEDTKRIAGHSLTSGCHWFDKSQWSMPTREVYGAWQHAAKGDGFKREYDELKREYDELKREFYATRAYFDNAHDNMTDVWSFPRVTGDDRHEHATPKPVEMIERVVKSSCPDGGIVYAPFAGTLPEVIAAENLSRQCRAVEISPAYVAVALQRYKDAFGIEPELIG